MQKNILALQTSPILGETAKNLCSVQALIENFSKENKKADFLFLGEVFATGWNTKRFEEFAKDEDEIINFLKTIAKTYNINVIGGSYIRKTEDGLKNSCPVFDRKGNLIAHYDKIHLFTPDDEDKYIKKGEKPLLVNLEGFKIGLSICYDIRFPELFRNYTKHNGRPHLMVNLSEWPEVRKNHYFTLSSARAIENETPFLALSLCGNDACGNTTLYNQNGDIIERLDDKTSFLFQTIDIDLIENTRKNFTHANNIQNFNFDVNSVK